MRVCACGCVTERLTWSVSDRVVRNCVSVSVRLSDMVCVYLSVPQSPVVSMSPGLSFGLLPFLPLTCILLQLRNSLTGLEADT